MGWSLFRDLGFHAVGFHKVRAFMKRRQFVAGAGGLALNAAFAPRNFFGAPAALLGLGTAAAFFGTGIFSGSGIIGSEIIPTSVRARALGFTYNGARAMSSVAPVVIGRVGQTKGLSWAFYLCAAGYLLAAVMTTQLPETKGKPLE